MVDTRGAYSTRRNGERGGNAEKEKARQEHGPAEDARPRVPLEELQAEGDVHGAGGVGDGAGGDVVGAGLGVGADGVEGNAPGELDLRATGDLGDPVAGFGGGQVVEEEMGGAAVESFAEL